MDLKRIWSEKFSGRKDQSFKHKTSYSRFAASLIMVEFRTSLYESCFYQPWMSNFLLLNFSMGPDGGDVVDHRGKKNLFVEDVLNYSLFALHGRSGSFSPLLLLLMEPASCCSCCCCNGKELSGCLLILQIYTWNCCLFRTFLTVNNLRVINLPSTLIWKYLPANTLPDLLLLLLQVLLGYSGLECMI